MVSSVASIRFNNTGDRITYNPLTGASRNAIAIDCHTAGLEARNVEIADNDISKFGTLSMDLGVIYVCCYINLKGGSLHDNWIHDAQVFSLFWATHSNYLDIESYNSIIHNNEVSNITRG